MKFPCPYCRKELNLMEMQHDADLLAIIKMLNSFGKYNALVAAYTELFGLTPLKSNTKKWRLLLEEMKRLFDSESFTHGKKTYTISQAGIAGALSLVAHRHFDEPLKSHGYLKAIMATVADREAQAAGRQAEKDLKKKEGRLMSGSRDEGERYPAPEESVEAPPVKIKSMPRTHLTQEEIEANRTRVKNLLVGIGTKPGDEK